MTDAQIEFAKTTFKERMGHPIVAMQSLGGISNFVYKVTDSTGSNYIFKILLSDKDDPLKKHEMENRVHIEKIYPAPLHESEHFRIEKFIVQHQFEMPHFTEVKNSCLLLKSVAKFNSLNTIAETRPNLFCLMDEDKGKIFSPIAVKLCDASKGDRKIFKSQLVRLERLLNVLRQEYKFENMVLSHNDLFYRNLIWDLHKKRYQLIDFEYAAYNPRGMDIFQFVNEWLTDYDVQGPPYFKLSMGYYPTPEQINIMIRYYLFWYEHGDKYEGREENEELLEEVRQTDAFKAVSEAEVERIAALFPYFGILANVFWYFWALQVYHVPGMNFDHVVFAKVKFFMIEYFVKELGNERVMECFAAKEGDSWEWATSNS